METICGKQTLELDGATLFARASGYEDVRMDIGTGDGRYVLHTARNRPHSLVIGIDTCREQLRYASRKAPPNAVFIIANALTLPEGLNELATQVSINFPWGSLLGGLLDKEQGLLDGLCMVMRPEGSVEVRLNAGALLELGWEPCIAVARVWRNMRDYGYEAALPAGLDAQALCAFPSTWAKRLAYGRAPHAYLLQAASPAAHREALAGRGAEALTG